MFAVCGAILTLPLTSAVAAAASDGRVEAAARWRADKIAELERQLASAELAPELRHERTARRNWLRRWQPGRMPTPKAAAEDGAGQAASDEKSPSADRLTAEPDLSEQATRAAKENSLSDELLQQLAQAARLQQRLWRLDTEDDRKANLLMTAEAAERLDRILVPLAERIGAEQPAVADSIRWALAHARYRRARAIAYRELPEVPASLPIEDAEAYERQLGEAHRRLRDTFDQPQPEFVLLEIRLLRRSGARGQALERLERFSWAIAPEWYLKKRRDLLEELGWEPPHAEAAELYEAFNRKATLQRQDE